MTVPYTCPICESNQRGEVCLGKTGKLKLKRVKGKLKRKRKLGWIKTEDCKRPTSGRRREDEAEEHTKFGCRKMKDVKYGVKVPTGILQVTLRCCHTQCDSGSTTGL